MNMTLLTISLVAFFFVGCKSNKHTNRLESNLKCSKIIRFIWDDRSNVAKYETLGDFKDGYASFWKGKPLNLKEIFIKSIKEFNEKYDGKYQYTEDPGFPSDSVIIVSVKLEKVVNHLGFSRLTKDLQLVYSTQDKEYGLIGTSIGYKGEKSYLKCFENANLQFLLANCSN